jgi:hypothetical protein
MGRRCREQSFFCVDERRDPLEERNQRRLELLESDAVLVIAIGERVDRGGGAGVERVLALDPWRQPLPDRM